MYYLGSVYQKTMQIVTRNNNTQIAHKPYWFVTLLRNLMTWKSNELMLLVIYNDVTKSS